MGLAGRAHGYQTAFTEFSEKTAYRYLRFTTIQLMLVLKDRRNFPNTALSIYQTPYRTSQMIKLQLSLNC